jgi:hypothetical protein
VLCAVDGESQGSGSLLTAVLAFAKTMAKAKLDECIFVSARGKKNRDLHFAFADVLATEIHVGLPSDHAGFDAMLSKTGSDMANLVIRFSGEANSLIVHGLKEWGFTLCIDSDTMNVPL